MEELDYCDRVYVFRDGVVSEKEKAAAAADDGVKLFIVPEALADEARRTSGSIS